jgi:hypothetical protein
MTPFVVLYRTPNLPDYDAPLSFEVISEDEMEAEELCLNTIQDADVVWVVLGSNVQYAYEDYYSACN